MRRGEIGGGQHCDNARRALGGSHVDVLDLGEGVRRAHEIGRQRAVRLDVVAEAALPAQQRVVLDAAGPDALRAAFDGIAVLRRREEAKAYDR